MRRAFDVCGSLLCVAVVVGRSHSNLRRHLNKEKELSLLRIAHSEVKNKMELNNQFPSTLSAGYIGTIAKQTSWPQWWSSRSSRMTSSRQTGMYESVRAQRGTRYRCCHLRPVHQYTMLTCAMSMYCEEAHLDCLFLLLHR